MTDRGFTLVELLVASVISLFVAAAALVLAGAARTALTVEPASIETARRLRAGADAVGAALASAGGERGIGDDAGTAASALPIVRLAGTAGAAVFSELTVIRVVQGGRGRLASDQPGPAGSLTLDVADGLCPRSGLVCGFDVGDVAVAFDGRGHFDVLIVGDVTEDLSRITPRAPLAFAYPAGAWVVAVRQERLLLVSQAGGSSTLTRITAAGAREPVVDGVTRLQLHAWGDPSPPSLLAATGRAGFAQYGLRPPASDHVDQEGIFAAGAHCMAFPDGSTTGTTLIPRAADDNGLAPLLPRDLDDGPWCPHDDAPDRFDADWFRLRRIDVDLEVEVLAEEFRGRVGSLFRRAGTAAHDAPRWVRDRAVRFSVAVPQ
jgi:prepilin-type N-terminal cleavage/methylation domain-containing protein